MNGPRRTVPAVSRRRHYEPKQESQRNLHRALLERYDFAEDQLKLKPIVGSKARMEAVGARLETLHDYLKLREEEVSGLSEAAGFGLAIAVGIHELGQLASAIATSARFISKTPTSDKVAPTKLATSREMLRVSLPNSRESRHCEAFETHYPDRQRPGKWLNWRETLWDRRWTKNAST